jgi:hypothetical protein
MNLHRMPRRLSIRGTSAIDDSGDKVLRPDEDDDEPDDRAPETPTDEPAPIPIQDPPPGDGATEPLTVTCPSSCPT